MSKTPQKILITGGAGFIGCNAVQRYVREGHEVVVVDNLSRKGTGMNLAWLKTQGAFAFAQVDLRDRAALEAVFEAHRDVDVVLHLAGQVAVTTSVVNPREDFEINALGTFNVLEAVRKYAPGAALIYASTNKVYGGLEHLGVAEKGGRYQFETLSTGVDEAMPLDFHSPYGCSKGAADQYVRDYARIYGLKTVCFRQSCIYGYRQFGVEDQGWVAWFTIATVLDKPITLYGDGKQVRDVLFVDDLVDAYQAAVREISRTAGQVYNLGGGPRNQMSLLELLEHLERMGEKKISYRFDKWRPGDQPVFVCDIRKAERDLGWTPKTPVLEGVSKLFGWVRENKHLFGEM